MTPSLFAKSVRLFLMDGIADGRWIGELSNWSGKVYKIPRTMIHNCNDRNELRSTGVYFLFGRGDEQSDRNKVYIGEAENIYDRLKQHLSGKDFWNEAIVFFSKDENLNKAHIKYLESRFHEIAINADRYAVLNSIKPTLSRVSEADKAELEEFLHYSQLMTNILGHKVLAPVLQHNDSTPKSPCFFIKATRGVDAKGLITSEGFVVTAGSKAAMELAPAFKKHNYLKLRTQLIAEGVLEPRGDQLIFEKDYIFNSPSAAAAIVMGRSASGPTEWKTAEGQILKSYEEG